MFIIDIVIKILILAIIVRAVLTWVNFDLGQDFNRYLYKITDPILRPIQQILSPYQIGIDISPIVGIFVLGLIRKLLFWALG